MLCFVNRLDKLVYNVIIVTGRVWTQLQDTLGTVSRMS